MIGRSALALVVAIVALAATSAPGQTGRGERPSLLVVQKDRAEGLGLAVRFGDVADVVGDDAELVARLRALEAAPLLPSGVPPLIARERLVELTRGAGVAPEAAAFVGSTTTRVEVRHVVLTAAQAADLAKRRIFEALGGEAGDARAHVAPPNEDLAVQPGRRRTTFEARLPARGRLAGSVKVEIVALVDDQAVRSVTVLADVRRRGPALVATRDLRPGASIAPEDVRVETRDLALLPSETLAEPTLAVGAVVARRVGAGMPLSSFDLKAKPVVFRGDEVEIRFEAGGLVVRGYGRALSDGAVGDRVEVLRAGERKPVEGRVVDARRVDVSPVSFKENRP